MPLGTNLDDYSFPENTSGVSGWSTFGNALFANRGNILEGIGQIGEFLGDQTSLNYLANALGITATQAGVSADLADTGFIAPQLQRQVLDIQMIGQKADSYDRWLGRYKSTRAGYAGAGILLDVGTPMAVTGKILASLDEELRYISVNRSIQEWNKIYMPTYQAESKKIDSMYAADMAEIDRNLATKTASINKTAGILGIIGKGLSSVGGMMGGFK